MLRAAQAARLSIHELTDGRSIDCPHAKYCEVLHCISLVCEPIEVEVVHPLLRGEGRAMEPAETRSS